MFRRLAATAACCLVAPVVAHAQTTTDHSAHHAPAASPKGFEGDFAMHFKGIELTAAQKAALVALRDEWHAKMDAIKTKATADGKADAPETTKQVDALKAQEHASFRALLTPAQQRQFDANMKEHDAMDSHKKGETAPSKKSGGAR